MDKDEKEFRALFAKNIKRCRKRLGLSQLDLAMELEISPNFLSDVETGKKWVSPGTFVKIAKVLKIDPSELLKPEAPVNQEASTITEKYLKDVSVSVKENIERSVSKLVDNMLHNLERIYL